ncbi:hypothetical protein [Acidovorax sp. 94]|uniref:hypothetical protein n=1 Tax=Acidovorax sp. 94 TaxID=2135633 RepID=UPI001314336B|nr:hypothetical protein [Acidovorax sp. 94]
MKQHPLSRFAPTPPALLTLRLGGGRSQRGGAALARLPVQGSRRFHRLRVAQCAVEN